MNEEFLFDDPLLKEPVDRLEAQELLFKLEEYLKL